MAKKKKDEKIIRLWVFTRSGRSAGSHVLRYRQPMTKKQFLETVKEYKKDSDGEDDTFSYSWEKRTMFVDEDYLNYY